MNVSVTSQANNLLQNMLTTTESTLMTSQATVATAINGTCFNFDNSAATVASQLILALVIVVLNSIVVTVIYTGPKKTYRKPAFVFIGGLATTDMLLALTLLASTAVAVGRYQLHADAWVVLTAITSICFNASVNFLLVVALDRLLFIGYNRSYRKAMTKRRVIALIVLCWVVALIPVFPLFVGQVGSCAKYCLCQAGKRMVCDHPLCSRVVKGLTKQFLFGLFFYFLGMLVSIGSVYLILFWKVKRHANRVRDLTDGSRGKTNRMKREFKLARTLGMVVAAFFFCWSPPMLLYVIDYASSDVVISETVALAILMPAVLNSLCNPLIYAARIPRMRRYLCPCARRVDETSTDGSGSRRGKDSKKNLPSIRKSTDKKTDTKNPSGKEYAQESAGTSQPSQGNSNMESTIGDLPSREEKTGKFGKVPFKIAKRIRSYIGRSTNEEDSAESGKLTNGFSQVNHDVSITPSAPNSGGDVIGGGNGGLDESKM